MLLAIDCGNTNIVMSVYDGAAQRALWRIETHPAPTVEQLIASVNDKLPEGGAAALSGLVAASVVPDVTDILRQFGTALGLRALIVGDSDIDVGVDVDVPHPEQVGADRIVNATACLERGLVPAIIIDFGTATTFDVVLGTPARARYAGGVIAPGVNLSVAALSAAAARLPEMNIEAWGADTPILGRTTDEAMQAGILWGYVGLVEGILSRLITSLSDAGQTGPTGAPPTTIATGGLAPLYAPHIQAISGVEQDLTLRGLCHIYAMNKDI